MSTAYAAGVLDIEDAMLTAYCRGYCSHRTLQLSSGEEKPGKIIRAGMAAKNAMDFCQQPQYYGKICVAAENSEYSVTRSGNSEAIDEAKEALDARGIFSSVFPVDKAYHSHHMDLV
jgi:acyl transferase domain-containing protein